MSISYFIDLKLRTDYNKENIERMLSQGEYLGFCYFDASKGIGEESIIKSVNNAISVFIKSVDDKYEDGSILRVKVDSDTYGFLDFYISEEGWLLVSLGSFGAPKKKVVDERSYFDFDHYIRLALDLCKDFAIVELKTESI